MTNEDYEDLYREALLCIGQQGIFEPPFFQDDGIRMCKVNGALLGDQEVSERWWGKKIANHINSEHRKTLDNKRTANAVRITKIAGPC